MISECNVLRMRYLFRVAKTGSRTMIHLMSILGRNLGYKLDIPYYIVENIQDSDSGIMKETGDIITSHSNGMIRSRHYSFIDFKQFGIDWNCIWFSMVRDPIERVSIYRVTKIKKDFEKCCLFRLFHTFTIEDPNILLKMLNCVRIQQKFGIRLTFY